MGWEVQLAGGVAMVHDGVPRSIGGPRQRLVLGILALAVGERVTTDRLIDLIWDDDPPRTARRTIQSDVAALRRVLGADCPVRSAGTGYVLDLDRGHVDVLADEDLATDVLQMADADPAKVDRLTEIADGWSEPLSDLVLPRRVRALISPLEELHLQVLDALVVALIDAGRAGDAVRKLGRLVREHPTREHLWAQSARGLAALGRRDDALRQLQRAREVLREELGVEPAAELRAIEADLLAGVPAAHGSRFDGDVSAVSGDGRPSAADPTALRTDVELLALLFTDVERSSEAWLSRSLEMTRWIPAISALVEEQCTARGGVVFGRDGDGRAVHFSDPYAAADAALAIGRAIATDPGAVGALALRMGLHAGPVHHLPDGQLGGTALNYASRLHACGHGGQILASPAFLDLLGPEAHGFRWTDLGVYALRDFAPDRIWQLDDHDRPSSYPPLRTRKRFEGPAPVRGPLYGRDDELAALWELLGVSSSTTVTGPGGIGKTRLVRGLIEQRGHEFADGVCFVDLQRVTQPAEVPHAVANALGVDTSIAASPVASVREALLGSRVLLVLDNCEHVGDAAREVVDAVVTASGPSVLATSRRPLHSEGEVVYPLGPLRGVDEGADDSEQLFLARAALAHPGFGTDPDSRASVSQICRLLGGVPLAIEVAAARMATLGPSDLLAILDDGLVVLEGGSGRASLPSALSWSIASLDPAAHEVGAALARMQPDARFVELEQLGVRSGAELVAALGDLVSTGIVRAEGEDKAYRYRMLQPLRRGFVDVAEPAVDPDRLAARHADVYAELAQRIGPLVQGADERAAVRDLTAEFGNIRTAMHHDLGTDELARAARTAITLHMYGFLRMRYEVYSWVETLLDRATGLDRGARSELIGMAAFRAFNRGDVDVAMRLAHEADDAAGEAGPITSRVVLMAGHGMAGQYDLANREFARGLHWCDEHEHDYYRSNLHVIASMGMTTQGVYDIAAELAGNALRLGEALANPSAVAWALAALADARRPTDPHGAAGLLASAVEIARAVSNRWVEGQALLNLSRVHRTLDDDERAVTTCVDALGHCISQANLIQSRQGLREAFLLLHRRGRHDVARRILEPLRRRADTLPPSPDQQRALDDAIAELRDTGDLDAVESPYAAPLGERDALVVARSALSGLDGALPDDVHRAASGAAP